MAARYVIPELVRQLPLCSICGNSVASDGTSFWCEDCGCTWGSEGEDGEWSDPDAEACGQEAPIKLNDGRTVTFTCVMDTGHDGAHTGFTDVIKYPRHWRGDGRVI